VKRVNSAGRTTWISANDGVIRWKAVLLHPKRAAACAHAEAKDHAGVCQVKLRDAPVTPESAGTTAAGGTCGRDVRFTTS
jgi:hypothetical protein